MKNKSLEVETVMLGVQELKGEEDEKLKSREQARREFYKSCQECEASPKWLYLELRLELEDP